MLSTLHELLEYTEPCPPTYTHSQSNVAAGHHQPPLAEPPQYHGSLSSFNGGVSAIPTIQETPDKTVYESSTAEHIGQKGEQRHTQRVTPKLSRMHATEVAAVASTRAGDTTTTER
jgi:hypothetical protein